MEKNWVCIFQTDRGFLAEIAKEVLFDNGIQAVTLDKKDSNYHFGVIEIYVDRKHAVKARHIMDEMEKTSNDINQPDNQ